MTCGHRSCSFSLAPGPQCRVLSGRMCWRVALAQSPQERSTARSSKLSAPSAEEALGRVFLILPLVLLEHFLMPVVTLGTMNPKVLPRESHSGTKPCPFPREGNGHRRFCHSRATCDLCSEATSDWSIFNQLRSPFILSHIHLTNTHQAPDQH